MGNRQGGRMTPRPDFFSQQKHVKRTEKLDGSNGDQDALSPQLHAAVFLSTGVHCGGTFHSPPDYALRAKIEAGSTDKDPNFVSMIFQEEKHAVSCPPHEHRPADRRADVSTADAGDPSEVTRAQTAVPPSSARRRDVLKPSNFETDPDRAKAELMVPQICSGIPSSLSFPKHRCLKADPAVAKAGDGVKSSAAVLTAACIDRLDYLKRNIEQCSTEHLTHFNNSGFAQLQCEAGYDDYDNTNDSKVPDARAHRRSKSMSPKTAAMIGTPQIDDKTKSTAVRKLSEPGHRVHRTNSTIPGVWSKSAENSPVIVRKALPNPGNPLIVQRTPSQSPSVERRFPANAPASPVILGNGTYSADTLKPRQHVYQKLSFQHQDCLESRDTSYSIRQKVIAEISLPRLSNSPVSARKMPESPVLLSSGIQHQGKDSGRENPPTTTADERSLLDWTPFGSYRAHYMKTPPTLSSCSSSSSESPQGKLPWREGNVSPSILLGTSSTSSSSATPCSSPPTPILFCPQPKGTPVRTCTMVSQPSTAVVLAGRDSQRTPQAMEVGVPPRDIQSGDQTTTVPQDDRRDAQAVSASSRGPPATSVVTEDTIKQNSQSAVFGSVSPKLLRHRRLIKNNSNHSHDQHTFPKQSHSVHVATAKTSPRKGDNSLLFVGDTACSDSCEHVHSSGDERSVQLSQSAPSSFSLHGSTTSASCVGNKTLGQRIREVINEATVGARLNRDTSSVSFSKQTSVFSKDDIFTRTSASVKSSLYSGPYINKRQRLLCDQTWSVRHEHMTGLTGGRREAKTAEEHRTKVPSSHAGSKDTMVESPHKISGHSYHLNSSRDSCASCVSDSSQMEFFDGTCFPNEVADLTQANLCRQAHWLTEGARSKQQVVLSAQLGAPGHRLVTSDTSDTLSTDRDTSSSSKRESSTSTATDDTLTSFKTRSTADSADYDEGFVLPESLVFIRSADKDAPDDMCAFDSEQTTIKRKLIQGQLHELRAEQELLPHKTRKKRRKQMHVQSQIITARPQQTDGTLTRHRTVREVYSDVISDDSDLSDSKDDISDLPSSRDDISDLPSSRDDISDLPSSRDDISDLPSSRDDISDVLSSRDNISDSACRKTRAAGGFSTAYTFSDTGTVQRCVFHRSDLQSSAKPVPSSVFERKPSGGKAAARGDTSTDLSDSDTHGIFGRGSSSSQGSRVTLSRLPGHVGDSGTVLSEGDGRRVTSGPGAKATCLAVLSTHSSRGESATGLTAAPLAKTNQRAERQYGCERAQDTSVSTYDENKGKQLLLQNPESPGSDDTVVLSYTVYNSSCQSVGACD